MRVRDRMSTGIVYAGPNLTLEDALRTMEARQVHHLVVRNLGRVAGIVSDRDVRLIATSTEQACAPAAALRAMLTSEAMNRSVVAVGPDATVADAAALMLDHQVDALLVVESGATVGLISELDLLECSAGRPKVDRCATADLPALLPDRVRQYRRVAVLGLTGDEGTPPALATARLMSFGVTVFPIHDTEVALLGVRCYPRVASVPGPVDVVHVFPQPDTDLEQVADDAVAKKAPVFWFEGKHLPASVERRLQEASIHVVVGHPLHAAYTRERG
jgi:CBS domain-containing protein/predicted CoA-binding protein